MDYNDGNWHGWNGGECPVHSETVVEYVYMSEGAPINEQDAAKHIRWDNGFLFPVIAFRIIKEHREPREWWISREPGCLPEVHGHNPMYHSGVEVIHVREVIE